MRILLFKCFGTYAGNTILLNTITKFIHGVPCPNQIPMEERNYVLSKKL